jgi:lysophospholipase II
MGQSCFQIPGKMSFGPIHVFGAETNHTHTIVLLHGRGSTGDEFAEEIFESTLSTPKSLQETFPTCRWVFPSSSTTWSATFQENMSAWFEASSLTNVTANQALQVKGIKESVRYIHAVLRHEIDLLGGISERVILGGISQGAAVGLWTFLSQKNPAQNLGAFFGASAWLPFENEIEMEFSARNSISNPEGVKGDGEEGVNFVHEMMNPLREFLLQSKGFHPLPPIFLGHGSDDAYVDVELGRQANRLLSQIGFMVEWKEYAGAEQEGHWLKVPDEMDDIVHFLKKVIASHSYVI